MFQLSKILKHIQDILMLLKFTEVGGLEVLWRRDRNEAKCDRHNFQLNKFSITTGWKTKNFFQEVLKKTSLNSHKLNYLNTGDCFFLLLFSPSFSIPPIFTFLFSFLSSTFPVEKMAKGKVGEIVFIRCRNFWKSFFHISSFRENAI